MPARRPQRFEAGLDHNQRIQLRDIVERSYYLESNQPILGRFSKQFLMQIASAFAPLVRQRQARIDRAE
jgi:hypothetical protein